MRRRALGSHGPEAAAGVLAPQCPRRSFVQTTDEIPLRSTLTSRLVAGTVADLSAELRAASRVAAASGVCRGRPPCVSWRCWQHFDIRQTGVAIHGNVDVVAAHPAAFHSFAAAVDPPAASLRDHPELLHINVQQLPGGVAFIALVGGPPGADAFAADRIQFAQPGRPPPWR